MNSAESESMEGIAIIGMAVSFPKSKNIEDFWQNLRDGVESISFFTDEELTASGIDPAVFSDANYVKAGAVLEDIDLFDASFFDLNPREAEITDPQHRLFLECAYVALENAGYDSQRCESRIGVYAGASLNNYYYFDLNRDQIGSSKCYQTVIGNDKDFLTTRVSYKLNLKGPSVTVQTACSTSLVATTLACQSLLNYQCDMALAGGVSIRVPQKTGYLYQEGGTLSPDGHCHAFDAKAKGTTIGNGVGVVVLKRLADAIADSDCIYAVIKGSAINNDGSLKVGYTAPSVDGQAEVIAEAMMLAGVEPETISYIEAHGTGTSLGDPIEISALSKVFRASSKKKGFCAIGSVKTNIGHLDAAAGIAGLLKTVLALKHKSIPPSLNFEHPNPQIDFANSPFYVNTTLCEWKAELTPRRAGVSSLGMGGTNAHMILEEAPALPVSSTSRPWQLLVLSAKTDSALETATQNLVEHFTQHADLNLADVAHTLQVGRREFNYRQILVCQDIEDAVSALKTQDPQRVLTHFQEPGDRPIAFMFPGQGAQYVNMGKELYQTEPIFWEQVDRCSYLAKLHLGLDLPSLIYPSESEAEAAAEKLKQTEITQLALFVIEYALAQLWMSWGIFPQAMIGHSIGEYVAACVAGVMSLEDALALVAARGRLMQQLPAGAMLAVSLPEAELIALLDEKLSLAASNAPDLCVVSGTHEAIDAFEDKLFAKTIDYRRLHTSHAFHSPMMDSILEPFTEEVKKVKLNPPQIPFVSNVTGTWITTEEATDPSYWARHLRSSVRFSSGITQLLQSNRILLEVGPGRTLCTFAKKHSAQADGQVALSSLRHPKDKQSDVAFLLNTLGKLWLSGVQVDWLGFYSHELRHRLPLPTYPFERQRYWIEPPAQAKSTSNRQTKLYKKPNIADWFYIPSWKRSLLPSQRRYAASKSKQKTCWLVFVDTVGVSSQIAKRLEVEGQDVITVMMGEQFTNESDRAYTINPQQRHDYHVLLKELRARNLLPNAIAHLWSLTPNEQAELPHQFFEECQNLGFYSLLFLTQALGKQEVTDDLQILVVTNNVQEVNGDERLYPEKATVLGLCKVIPQEYPNITCRHIDVVTSEAGTFQEKQIIEQLVAEINIKPSENVVAYRGKHRWVQTFEPAKLEEPIEEATPLRQGGVYLITGGLGGIGLVLAEYLAQTVCAKLILIGRSELPSKDEWSQWIATHNDQDEVSYKIRKVQALEALGADVLVKSADVSNQKQMQEVLTLARERFGEIHGVIHAAGVRSYNTVQEISLTECERQFRPKVQGLFALEEVLQGKELDFCLLISSLASVLGVLGQAAYPAAHIFMDVFAHRHNQTKPVRWLSVNWDNWLTEKIAELVTKTKAAELPFMTPKEAGKAFQRILSINTVTQVVVSSGALEARLEQCIQHQALGDIENSNKVDSLSLYSRPNLQNTYVAPRNHVEQTLADIWQQLLGIERLGIYDNFFELGGDSVISIQLVARANQAGLQISTQQVFEHQAIAELAAVAGITQVWQAEQGLVTGSLPLTPIQHWFFEQNQPDLHHWNQAVLLEVPQVLDPAMLEKALQQLLMHHDALRLRFTQSESGWQQFIASPDEVVPFTQVDLSVLLTDEQSAMEAAATELQSSLNLSSGPLMRVALFDCGANKPRRLLIVIHHLAVDVVSWRILLDDLQTAYQQLISGKAIQLPLKTSSFKQWAERLSEYAQSAAAQRELDYWLANSHSQVSRLPVDYPGGDNTVASAQTVSVALSVEETQALLQEVPAVYQTQTEEVLLTALVQTFARLTGVASLLVDLEGSGREVIFENIDLSRTIGWFTTISPVVLDLGETGNPEDALKAVKEQLRRSNQGIGYGVLRYLSGDRAAEKLRTLPGAPVIFLYLGQFENSLPKSSLFKLTREFSGSERSPRGIRLHLLEVIGLIVEGQLQLNWTYSENVHQRGTVEGLAQSFVEALRLLIAHCQSSEAGGYTPSDFPDVELSQEKLEKLLEEINL